MIEARSPKLGSLVQHYDQASFQQWIRLEADPALFTSLVVSAIARCMTVA